MQATHVKSNKYFIKTLLSLTVALLFHQLVGSDVHCQINYPNGSLIKSDSPPIYIISGGMRRWIAVWDEFLGAGLRLEDVKKVSDSEIASIPAGDPLVSRNEIAAIRGSSAYSKDGTLIKGGPLPIYIVSGGKRRHILNWPHFIGAGLTMNQVRTVPDSIISAIPDGDSIKSREELRHILTSSAARGNYIIRLGEFEINKTRSRGKDTIWATLGVEVGENKHVKTVRIGDLNDGKHNANLEFEVPISDLNSVVRINYVLANIGHLDNRKVEDAMNKGTTAALDEANIPGPWGTIIGIAKSIGLDVFFANCDGLVAQDQLELSGGEAAFLGSRPGAYVNTKSHAGSDSSSGCGANSQYTVTLSITKK